MRRHPNALIAMTYAAALSMCAAPRSPDETTEEERKTPPAPAKDYPLKFVNLPGETNRQFAARMKAKATTASSVGTDGPQSGPGVNQ